MNRLQKIEDKVNAAQALVNTARDELVEIRETFEAILSETVKIAELTSVIADLKRGSWEQRQRRLERLEAARKRVEERKAQRPDQ